MVHYSKKAPKKRINFPTLSLFLENFHLQDRSTCLPFITSFSALYFYLSLFVQKKDLTSLLIISSRYFFVNQLFAGN